MNKGAAKYHCPNCGRYFNDLTKTIFEHHKFPIEVLHLEGDGETAGERNQAG